MKSQDVEALHVYPASLEVVCQFHFELSASQDVVKHVSSFVNAFLGFQADLNVVGVFCALTQEFDIQYALERPIRQMIRHLTFECLMHRRMRVDRVF